MIRLVPLIIQDLSPHLKVCVLNHICQGLLPSNVLYLQVLGIRMLILSGVIGLSTMGGKTGIYLNLDQKGLCWLMLIIMMIVWVLYPQIGASGFVLRGAVGISKAHRWSWRLNFSMTS